MDIRIGMLILFVSACNNPESPAIDPEATNGAYHAAFLIMDGVYNTELTAPYDIFQHTRYREGIKPIEVFTIAQSKAIITTFEGLRIIPDYSFRDSHPPIDILVVPSAEHHLDSDLENKALIDWVFTTGQNAQFVTSHCDGSFILAKSGLLDGHVSTTFPSDIVAYRNMFPQLEVIDSTHIVHDGKFITSAGGARSFDAALYLCEWLYGKEIADQLAGGLVIDWNLSETSYYKTERTVRSAGLQQ